MSKETEEQQSRLKKLMDGIELTKSGYAGIDKDGNKVDRRLFPDAVPLQYNPSLGIPHQKRVTNKPPYNCPTEYEGDGECTYPKCDCEWIL